MVEQASETPISAPATPGRIKRFLDGDIWYSFTRSPVVVLSAIFLTVALLAAAFAPVVAPHDPFDLASIDIMDSSLPPAWDESEGDTRFWLGTDDQGRDVLSTIIYGARISLIVGIASVLFSLVMGVGLGLVSGYVGGRVDAFIMRVADIQLSFPSILIALLIDGVARSVMPREMHQDLAFYVLIFAIGISGWVQYARTVRGSTMVEREKEYVQAARVIGMGPGLILWRHVLPNVMGPVLVIATIHLAIAIITEATLSFLGVGCADDAVSGHADPDRQ